MLVLNSEPPDRQSKISRLTPSLRTILTVLVAVLEQVRASGVKHVFRDTQFLQLDITLGGCGTLTLSMLWTHFERRPILLPSVVTNKVTQNKSDAVFSWLQTQIGYYFSCVSQTWLSPFISVWVVSRVYPNQWDMLGKHCTIVLWNHSYVRVCFIQWIWKHGLRLWEDNLERLVRTREMCCRGTSTLSPSNLFTPAIIPLVSLCVLSLPSHVSLLAVAIHHCPANCSAILL
jgi:hypothetical protein